MKTVLGFVLASAALIALIFLLWRGYVGAVIRAENGQDPVLHIGR